MKELLTKDKIYLAIGIISVALVCTILKVDYAKEVTLMVVSGVLAIVKD